MTGGGGDVRGHGRPGFVLAAVVMAGFLSFLSAEGASAGPFGADVSTNPVNLANRGWDTSIVIDSSGNPAIAYYDAFSSDVRILRCTNPDCSGSQTPLGPDVAAEVGRFVSLALDGSGFPVMSYYDGLNGALRVLHCTNPDCSGPQTPRIVDSAGEVGQYSSLVLDSSGNPVISYNDADNANLKVLRCTNPDCSGSQTPITPDSQGNVGVHTSLVLDGSGNPVIAYKDMTNGDLRVLRCTTPDCSGPQASQAPDTEGEVGNWTSIVLDSSGNPIISYADVTNRDLRVLRCTNADCSGTQTPRTLDSAGNVGSYTSVALDRAGYPIVSYSNTSELRLLRCTNPDCSGTQTPISPALAGRDGWFTSIALDEVGNAVISYFDNSGAGLRVLHCYDPDGCGGLDQDLDGVTHAVDNCPATPNSDQADTDSDGAGDVCDPNDDNDALPDGQDNCPLAPNSDQADVDTDNIGDACDEVDNRIPTVCVGAQGVNVIIGTPGDDVLIGTSARDVILGLGGDDTLIGRGGNDCILGGPGSDTIRGGLGADILRGGRGSDNIRGQRGSDDIKGQRGADRLRGGTGADLLLGGSGRDWIAGNSGRDTISGGKGADKIFGGNSADLILGNKGDDTINGGKGRDRCSGGAGVDTVVRCEGW